MAKPPERETTAADGLTVAEVFDNYLAWCQKDREPRPYEWYRDRIQDFINH